MEVVPYLIPTIFGLTGAAAALAVAIGNFLIYGYSLYSISRARSAAKDARRAAAAFAAQIQERMQMVRQAITARRTIYGTVRVSGPMTFFHSTNNNQHVHILITLAGHDIDGIDDIYFNDEYAPLADDGTVLAGRWNGYAIVKKGLGTTAGDADLLAYMVANTAGKWTANHKQVGCAKIYVKFIFSRDLLGQGVPNISCVVRGKKVYDPRTSITKWSDNPALCVRDYLTSTFNSLGVGATASEVDDTVIIASANTCDERVTFAGRSVTFNQQSWSPLAPITVRQVAASSVILPNIIYVHRVTFVRGATESTAGPPSAGIYWTDVRSSQPPTRFYITGIIVGPTGTTARKIYREEYNYATGALTRTVLVGTISDNSTIDFTDTSAGTLASPPTTSTVIQNSEFTLLSGTHMSTGDSFTLSTTGTLPAPLATATAYYWIRLSPTVGQMASTFANAVARTPIAITTLGAGASHTLTVASEPRYTCNGIIESTDTPQQSLIGLLSSMAGVLTYPGGKFTVYAGAWRSPAITLTANNLDGPVQVNSRVSRREVFNGVKGIFSSPSDLWQPTDFPPVTNATYLSADQGERMWSEISLPFTTSYSMAQRLAKISLEKVRQQITVVLQCNLSALRIQIGDVVGFTYDRFGWAAKSFEVVELKMITRGSGAEQRIGIDLTLRETASAVYDWNNGEETIVDPAPDTSLANPNIVNTPSNLLLESGTAQLYLRKDGTVFSRIKASWTATTDAYVINGGSVELQYRVSNVVDWTMADTLNGAESYAYILDVQDDYQYDVRIRFRNQIGIYSGWVYSFGHLVIGKTAPPANVTGFAAGQNGNVVVLTWNQVADIDLAGYEIRYITQGLSNWDAAVALTKVTRGTQITTAGLPPGSWTLLIKARDTSENYSATAAAYNIVMTNAFDVIVTMSDEPDFLGAKTNFVYHWTGLLVPDSQDAASLDTWNTFDIFVPNPFAMCSYVANKDIDLLFASTVRVWVDMAATLGPGVVVGFPNPKLEIDYHSGAGFDGYEPWTIGAIIARYVRTKLVLLTADGVAYVSRFQTTADVESHTETGAGVVVGATGTAIVFAKRYHFTPSVQITVQGAGLIPGYTAASGTGFTAHVYNTAGTQVGGTISWTSDGE